METLDQVQKEPKSLEEIYLGFLRLSIDKEGINPAPGAYKVYGDDGISMISFMLSPIEIFQAVAKIMRENNVEEFLWGLDRFNKAGQGVDEKYHSVFTIFHFKNGKWRTGVLAYNSQEDNYKEVDWWNEFWEKMMTSELKQAKLI